MFPLSPCQLVAQEQNHGPTRWFGRSMPAGGGAAGPAGGADRRRGRAGGGHGWLGWLHVGAAPGMPSAEAADTRW